MTQRLRYTVVAGLLAGLCAPPAVTRAQTSTGIDEEADLGDATRGEAQNVNTLDEVPDSSWFTNRHGVRRMSRDELVRGPDTIEGPDMSAPWRVFRSKIGGLTPGF